MLYIRWQESNNLGIEIIDEQHRGVVSVINSYYHYVRTGKSKEALILTKGILDEMTALHFKTEEAYLTEHGYPHLPSHAILHEKLFRTMARSFEDSLKNDDPDSFLRFLKDWWLHHINEEDRTYARYLEVNGKLDK